MNNVNMGGMGGMNPMNAMGGGPVGGGNPMMNNGTAGGPRPANVADNAVRAQLNTYIYDYFCRHGMWDCARALMNSDQPIRMEKTSPGRRDDNMNGNEDGDDSKDDMEPKRPNDLPAPVLPDASPESCFLFDWWSLFWDMFNAQRGKADGRGVQQYVTHTQTINRQRQDAQTNMLRQMRPDQQMGAVQYQQMMMAQRNAANGGINLNQNDIHRKAIQNRQNPGQMAMIQQQKNNQLQMQRDPSNSEQQRSGSPGSAENGQSPSKRPRLDGTPFNPQGMQNGRGQAQGIPGQQVGDTGPNAIQAAHIQLNNGMEPNGLTAQQFQNFPGANPAAKIAYQQSLAQHQQGQMPGKNMPNPGGPQHQGSPMMTGGPDSGSIGAFYNTQDMNGPGGRMQNGPQGAQPNGGGNHALQDYQMQLMLLEQQNKKRLMMARQEQDNFGGPGRSDQGGGPAAPSMGPNGSFQGTSPQGQGPRSVNSPNPNEMKRGTPHMNTAGIPSPVPEGQSRNSPSTMGTFMPNGQMESSMPGQQFYNSAMGNGMAPNMRPPTSAQHPGFNGGQVPPQQQRPQGWPAGSNTPMMPNAQGQTAMGTPQQRNMPPPAAPTTGAGANGRTQTSSPQQPGQAPPTPSQANKANPKKKTESKDAKAKRAATKKGSAANLNAGATPSADTNQEAATPTPATPSTPLHTKGFTGQNGAGQPAANGQPSATSTAPIAQQPDMNSFIDNQPAFEMQNYNFEDPAGGNMNVLQDFDFDSFLVPDDQDAFNFDASTFLNDSEIQAE